jgi:hypothetical protein
MTSSSVKSPAGLNQPDSVTFAGDDNWSAHQAVSSSELIKT